MIKKSNGFLATAPEPQDSLRLGRGQVIALFATQTQPVKQWWLINSSLAGGHEVPKPDYAMSGRSRTMIAVDTEGVCAREKGRIRGDLGPKHRPGQ